MSKLPKNVEIYKSNSYSNLHLPIEHIRRVHEIDKLLSVEIPNAAFIIRGLKRKGKNIKALFRDNHMHFYAKNTGRFPTGLIKTITGYFDNAGVNYTIFNREEVTNLPDIRTYSDHDIKNLLQGIELRDMQVGAVKTAYNARRGLLHCATNAGKTEMGMALIELTQKANNIPVLWLTHRKEIFFQTQLRMQAQLQIVPSLIYDGGIENHSDNVTIAMVQTLYSEMQKKVRSSDIMSTIRNAKMLILDECHLASSDSWYNLAMATGAEFRYGLSGTPFKSDPVANTKLMGATGDVIYRITNTELIEAGFSQDPVIITLNYTPAISTMETKYNEIYDRHIVYSVPRNREIVKASLKALQDNRKVLILITKIAHGELLLDILRETGRSVKFIHGNTDNSSRVTAFDDFKNNRLDILIASSILREGIDVKNIGCLIMGFGGMSNVQTLQSIGRALRKKVTDTRPVLIVDFIDCIAPHLMTHFMERYNIYQQEGFRIVQTFEEV